MKIARKNVVKFGSAGDAGVKMECRAFPLEPGFKYVCNLDIKGGGAHSFYTDYNNPTVVKLSHEAQRETNIPKRAKLYNKLQQIAAHDAFLGFLYYSPFRYAYSSKLHGFFVYPLGNYHLEDAWLG